MLQLCRSTEIANSVQGRLPLSEVLPIKILMEFLFDLLRTVEFLPRLLNLRIARESFQQNRRLLVCRLFLVFASDRERRGKRVQFRRPLLHAHCDFHHFRHLNPQGLEIGGFRFRIINRLLGKLCRRWITLKHFQLLLDRSRKTSRCIYEYVQFFVRKGRRDQAKENDRSTFQEWHFVKARFPGTVVPQSREDRQAFMVTISPKRSNWLISGFNRHPVRFASLIFPAPPDLSFRT